MELMKKALKALKEEARHEFVSETGIEPDSVAGDIIHVGDWKLRYELSGAFQLWGSCPECGRKCWSSYCYSLADIGKQFVAFQPEDHCCLPPEEQTEA